MPLPVGMGTGMGMCDFTHKLAVLANLWVIFLEVLPSSLFVRSLACYNQINRNVLYALRIAHAAHHIHWKQYDVDRMRCLC